ncbi:unnamed protein product, partial [Nesidiocoris tenuis]
CYQVVEVIRRVTYFHNLSTRWHSTNTRQQHSHDTSSKTERFTHAEELTGTTSTGLTLSRSSKSVERQT